MRVSSSRLAAVLARTRTASATRVPLPTLRSPARFASQRAFRRTRPFKTWSVILLFAIFLPVRIGIIALVISVNWRNGHPFSSIPIGTATTTLDSLDRVIAVHARHAKTERGPSSTRSARGAPSGTASCRSCRSVRITSLTTVTAVTMMLE